MLIHGHFVAIFVFHESDKLWESDKERKDGDCLHATLNCRKIIICIAEFVSFGKENVNNCICFPAAASLQQSFTLYS
jgi:hypothetical protein